MCIFAIEFCICSHIFGIVQKPWNRWQFYTFNDCCLPKTCFCHSPSGVLFRFVFQYVYHVFELILASFWYPFCDLAGSFCLTCWGPFFYRFLEQFLNDFGTVSGTHTRCKIGPIRNWNRPLFNDSSTLLEKRGCSIQNRNKIDVFFSTHCQKGHLGALGLPLGSLWARFGRPLGAIW